MGWLRRSPNHYGAQVFDELTPEQVAAVEEWRAQMDARDEGGE